MTNWGVWSIEEVLFDWLKSNLKSGETLVEIGSGEASLPLSKIYKLYSIEENIDWVNKFHDNYIYAPIVDSWYDPIKVEKSLPDEIDAVLIDGPAHGERILFLNHIKLFLDRKTKLLIFDDVNRREDFLGYESVVVFLQKNGYNIEYDIITNNKQFAFIKIKY